MTTGSTVSAICTGGSGSAATKADGSFQLTSTGTLPCYLRATDITDSSQQFHSIASGSGTTTTANISPLTELVVAQAVGASMSPSDAFDNGAAPSSSVASSLDQAINTTMNALNSAGISGVTGLTGVDPIKSTSFKPAVNGQQGDPIDQAIDSLNAALATSSSSIGQLATAITTSTSSNRAASISAYTSTPQNTECPSLRNMKHRMVTLGGEYHTLIPTSARTLNGTSDSGAQGTISIAWNTTHDNYCKFTFTSTVGTASAPYAGTGTGAVSKASGAIAVKGSVNGAPYLALAFPDQNIPISALAGNWNTIGFDATLKRSKYLTFTLDAAGNASNFQSCSGSLAATCSAMSGSGSVALDTSAQGGYIFTDSSGLQHHAYAFRGASGNISLIVANANHTGITVAAQQRTLKLPVALNSPIEYADIETYLNNSSSYSVGYWDNVIVVNNNTGASTYQRTRTLNNGQTDGRMDVVTINSPRSGMRTRPSSACTLGAIGTRCPDSIQMPLPDMGMNVYGGNGSTTGGTAEDFFGVSMTVSQ